MSEYRFTKSNKGERKLQETRKMILWNVRNGKRCPTFTYTYRYNLRRCVSIFENDADVRQWIETTYANELEKLADPSNTIIYCTRDGWTLMSEKRNQTYYGRNRRARRRRDTLGLDEKGVFRRSQMDWKLKKLHPDAYRARLEYARANGGDFNIWIG